MEQAARRDRMSLLAKAPAERLAALWRDLGLAPDFTWLRTPEIGGVMVRGRTGGTGAPFNLGEMTVTRASVQLTGGAVGHAYVQGRDKDKARVAALIDALMQGGDAARIDAGVLAPLRAEQAAARHRRAAKAAATKVDFFTLVRGED
ncbi:MAG: phosphonate C-P lyase system protein PhnG [Rhodobacteraceae bacterium]|nr:phosphonate C-P lyase system protein PhnG [Paracoccaceae bacterium]